MSDRRPDAGTVQYAASSRHKAASEGSSVDLPGSFRSPKRAAANRRAPRGPGVNRYLLASTRGPRSHVLSM
eukprot:749086-Hanusia_phi.AAC.6